MLNDQKQEIRAQIHSTIQRLICLLTSLETARTTESIVDQYCDAFFNFKASLEFGRQLKSRLNRFKSTATETQSQQSIIDLDNSSKESTELDNTQKSAIVRKRSSAEALGDSVLDVMFAHKSKTPQKLCADNLNTLFAARQPNYAPSAEYAD